jgi:hypothetical protein
MLGDRDLGFIHKIAFVDAGQESDQLLLSILARAFAAVEPAHTLAAGLAGELDLDFPTILAAPADAVAHGQPLLASLVA